MRNTHYSQPSNCADGTMTCCPVPCQKANALTWLMCPDLLHVAASVKVLGEVAQERKGSLAERFLQDSHREECIKVLMSLLSSYDLWLCSAAAFIFGMLLENEAMVRKLQEWTQGDCDLCRVLGQLLLSDEPSVVLNAAGAVATLVETPMGRQWLLQDAAVFSQVLESVSCLLDHEIESTVNSAALILARLSLCEVACQKLVSHPSASRTFNRLAQCLAHGHTDTAMNAAFTIGRLCGSDKGRSLILAEAKAHRLAPSLQALLSSRAGLEVRQTACFALSCLASEQDGHALLMESPSLPALLDGLLSLLQSRDPDTTWFAAMTVRFLVSQPAGVVRVREHSSLEEQLKDLSLSASTGLELQEELSACQRKLRRLPKPSSIAVQHLQSGVCIASWERLEPESGLEVTYNLYDGDTVLYRGPLCQFNLSQAHLWSKHCLSLRLKLTTSDGDTSPFSEPVELTTERAGIRPGPPRELRVIGCTPTQLQLCWAEPTGGFKPKSFQVYCDDILVETTIEMGSTVSSLCPSTTYTLSVCAVGPGDVAGPCSSISAQTTEGYEHAPCSLTVVVLGRHELDISWRAPVVPLGRLFNYELHLNGHVAYLGTERVYKACRLTANTPYTCAVTAITSRGRCQSKPVTKKTANDEYLNTSSQQRTLKPLAPPVVRDVHEVNDRGRKPDPKVRLTGRNHTDPNLSRDRHRLPPVRSHRTEKNKSSNRPSEMSAIPVSKSGVNGLQNNATQRSPTEVFPANTPNYTLIPHQECTHTRTEDAHTLQSHCQLSSKLSLSKTRQKVNLGLLQQCGTGRTRSDSERLPLLGQKTPERVRLLQPVSYNWSDLDGREQKQIYSNRFATGPRLHSHFKGRCQSTSQLAK